MISKESYIQNIQNKVMSQVKGMSRGFMEWKTMAKVLKWGLADMNSKY